MKRAKAMIGIVLLLALGALAGALGTGYLMKQRIQDFFHGPEPPLSMILNRMSRELELSREQQEKIRPILKKTRTKMTALREKYRPEFQSVFNGSLRDIEAILNDEQKPKLNQFLERMRHHRPPPGPGGPPGPPGPRRPPPLADASALAEHLGLTEAQADRAEPLLTQSLAQQRALRETVEKAHRAAMAQAGQTQREWALRRKALDDRLAEILDKDQMTEYRRWMDVRDPGPPKAPFGEAPPAPPAE